jgi:hypothetical protein
MLKQLAVGLVIAVLAVALLPKVLPGGMIVLGTGIVLLVGIIGLMIF